MVSLPLRSCTKFADLTPLRSHEITRRDIPGPRDEAAKQFCRRHLHVRLSDHFIIAVFGAAGAEKNIKTITLLVFFGAEGAEIFWDERYTTLRRYTTLTVTLVTHSPLARGSGMRNIQSSVTALSPTDMSKSLCSRDIG